MTAFKLPHVHGKAGTSNIYGQFEHKGKVIIRSDVFHSVLLAALPHFRGVANVRERRGMDMEQSVPEAVQKVKIGKCEMSRHKFIPTVYRGTRLYVFKPRKDTLTKGQNEE